MSTLFKLIQAQFGIETTPKKQPLVTQIETTATRFVQANPNRVGLILSNTGLSTIYIGLTNEVSATAGIPMFAGGSITLSWDSDFEAVGVERWAIAVGAASTCYVEEIVIVAGEQGVE